LNHQSVPNILPTIEQVNIPLVAETSNTAPAILVSNAPEENIRVPSKISENVIPTENDVVKTTEVMNYTNTRPKLNVGNYKDVGKYRTLIRFTHKYPKFPLDSFNYAVDGSNWICVLIFVTCIFIFVNVVLCGRRICLPPKVSTRL